MIEERKQLDKQILALQAKLDTCPDGKLVCTNDGKRFKWYKSDGKTSTYIPRKDRPLAEQLALKKYLSYQLEELQSEKRAIEFYLRHHVSSPGKSEKLLTELPAYRELLSPHFKPLSQELTEWMKSPFESNQNYPEYLVHKTISGHLVRSKSEALIDMVLSIHKIPFRYECALHLGETVLYPDFTIRHPATGKTYYWEHFGKMDYPGYCKNTYSKLQLYSTHGIVPSIQLITTFETGNHPLTTEKLERLVKEYFLFD